MINPTDGIFSENRSSLIVDSMINPTDGISSRNRSSRITDRMNNQTDGIFTLKSIKSDRRSNDQSG